MFSSIVFLPSNFLVLSINTNNKGCKLSPPKRVKEGFFTLQNHGLYCINFKALFTHDTLLSSLPIKAAAKAMIDQFPWLQTLDTAAIARQSKSADDIIRSATFPAAHAPSPDDSLQSEGICCPYALLVLGTVDSWWACSLYCLLAVHQALCHSLTAPISLQQKLCIPALLWVPALFRVSAVFSF